MKLRKILCMVLCAAMLFSLAGCKDKVKREEEEKEMIKYSDLYKQEVTAPYPEDSERKIFKASHGYTLMNKQGYNGWYYVDGNGTQLKFSDGEWRGDGGYIQDKYMVAEGGVIARKFIVPVSFNAVISAAVECEIGSADVRIYNGTKQIYPADGGPCEITEGEKIYVDAKAYVTAGSELVFRVGGNARVRFNPEVRDESVKEGSLHYTLPEGTANGIYLGDVHPFYDDGKMYMFYLNTGGGYESKLVVSDNMLQYSPEFITSAPANPPEQDAYYVLGVVKQGDEYRSYFGVGDGFASSVSSDLHTWANACYVDDKFNVTHKAFFDYDKYPGGGRDPFVFYDPDADRYRVIGMCYTEAGKDRSLVLYTSTDAEGNVWEASPTELIRFPEQSDGDPECPQMFKIGNRWYIFASRYGHSPHGVGRLSYWIGDENTPIDGQDWSSKTEHYLDGEDLCAAQIVAVGEKYYMFGWFPQDYAGGNWGGPLNLPREVFQRDDGTLGSRIDPALDELLDRGVMKKVGSRDDLSSQTGNVAVSDGVLTVTDGKAMLEGEYDRTYIKCDVTLEGREAGFVMDVGGKKYRVRFTAQGGAVKMSVTADGESHAPYSQIQTDIKVGETFDVKIVVDRGCWEIIAGDEWGLCARTSLGDRSYAVGAYSDGTATFEDLRVCKLASCENVFD